MRFFFKSAAAQTLAKTFFNLGTFFVHIIFFAFLGLQALFYISILFWSPAVSSSWGISVLICFELTETNHILSLSRSYLDHVIICSVVFWEQWNPVNILMRVRWRCLRRVTVFSGVSATVLPMQSAGLFWWSQCDYPLVVLPQLGSAPLSCASWARKSGAEPVHWLDKADSSQAIRHGSKLVRASSATSLLPN